MVTHQCHLSFWSFSFWTACKEKEEVEIKKRERQTACVREGPKEGCFFFPYISCVKCYSIIIKE